MTDRRRFEELGALLFHRTARGVTLTAQGELLLSAANRIAREMDDVVSQISDTQTLRRGLLTLGGGMTVCLYILPKLLRKFRAHHKQVDLRVVTGATDGSLLLVDPFTTGSSAPWAGGRWPSPPGRPAIRPPPG